MPRRNHRHQAARHSGKRGNAPKQRELPHFGSTFQSTRHEPGPGRLGQEEFLVRDISAGQAAKWYRCPGCDQEIAPGVAHIVAWPADYGGRAEDRRHWHKNCWTKRATRGITRRWG